ncbi:unnamed protein product [Prorocentrum cordatum]|uniref:Selenoprotein O n=1 Tax=Prorocentrum cordatum TaxID=2364126 RepID=A0ABN9STB1_9DINO|nr:unnamed protein product [Polarella glacialis]
MFGNIINPPPSSSKFGCCSRALGMRPHQTASLWARQGGSFTVQVTRCQRLRADDCTHGEEDRPTVKLHTWRQPETSLTTEFANTCGMIKPPLCTMEVWGN